MVAATIQAPLKQMPSKRLKANVVTTYVDDETKAALEEWAADDSRSMSALVALILKKAVSDRKNQKEQGNSVE